MMVSVSVCQAGPPGSSPARSVCFTKVEFYQNVINLSPPVPTTGSAKAFHVLSCLCDNACKRPLAIYLSLCGVHVLNRDVKQRNKHTCIRVVYAHLLNVLCQSLANNEK